MPFPQYIQMPDNALKAACDSLAIFGFKPKMIGNEYHLSIPNGKFIVNSIAFTHETRRTLDYTGFTLFNAAGDREESEIVRILAKSAAPFHLIHRKSNNFSFWFSNVDVNGKWEVKPNLIKSDIGYDTLTDELKEYTEDIKPQHIIDVKQRRSEFNHQKFKESGPFQLSLWAINVTEDLLVKQFGRTVNELRGYRDSAIPDQEITDIAIQLLGAIILANTGVLKGDNIPPKEISLAQLIRAVQDKFQKYFDIRLFEKWHDATELAYQTLTKLHYSGFAPEMLTKLYREAYPDKKKRRETGRYDTPLHLTRRIWDNIPVEFLPPENRVVADMTCGWGSFLIAGYERLSRMIDMEERSLNGFITGNDIDPFTSRLAGLGLLISTSEDSWDIDSHDAEKWMKSKWSDRRPNIIVGNPPFGGNRKIISGQEKRYQKADSFLEYAIDYLAPGGYLAMIMPQSFTSAESSPELRKKLLQTCDIEELWELPIGMFPDATVNTIVIFARKKVSEAKSDFAARVRILQKNTLPKFEESGIFTASEIISDQSDWNETSRKSRCSENTHIMDFKLILPDSSWNKIQSRCTNLSELAEIFFGAEIGKNINRKRWINYLYPKKVNWLSRAKNTINKSFAVNYDFAETIIYPNSLREPLKNKNPLKDKEHFLAGKKILLTSNANPSWGKRIKVAIERRGYYASDSFIVIVPKSEAEKSFITKEVIAAVLDWKVSNAWITEHLKHPKIPMRAMKNLPFPYLNEVDCKELTQAVCEIETAVKKSEDYPIEARQSIDRILKAAYQLEDEEFERLRLIYEWDDNPQITIDKQPEPDMRWKTTGVVESIDPEKETITLWISDFDELQTVPISPSMPGWLLRPEAAFRTVIPRACVRKRKLGNILLGKFYPQDYTYLTEDELFEKLTDLLSVEKTEA